MKKVHQQIIYVLCIVIITIGGLTYLSELVRPKETYYRKTTFMENAENIDVLFLGTSHMVNAIYPIELWNEYGIAAYNMGGHGHPMASSYWLMMNALDYCSPELIVIDCQSIANDERKASLDYSHWTMDNFPISKNKIAAVFDLYDDSSKRMEYLWDFSLYHSRWNEITQADYQKEESLYYGGEPRIAVAVPDTPIDIAACVKTDLDTLGTQYLRKIIEECQKRKIEVLLTYLPFPVTKESNVNESFNAEAIAKEYGIECVNFLKMDIVDYNTDCYDSGSHLNPSGAKKVTEWLGKYIQITYQIQNRKEEVAYSKWNEDYIKYQSQNIETIKKEFLLDNYLMMLRNKEFSVCIYLKEDSAIYSDERLVNLIKNISQYEDIKKLDDSNLTKKDYMLVIDNGWKKIWECVGDENIEEMKEINSTFGNVSYFSESAYKTLYIQNSKENLIVSQTDNKIPDIQIVLINRTTGAVEDVKRFVKENDNFVLWDSKRN